MRCTRLLCRSDPMRPAQRQHRAGLQQHAHRLGHSNDVFSHYARVSDKYQNVRLLIINRVPYGNPDLLSKPVCSVFGFVGVLRSDPHL